MLDSQQRGIQEDTTYRVDLICGCSTGDKGEMMITQQTPLVAVSTWIILKQKVLVLLVVL